MTWEEAIKHSPERCAVLLRGDYPYLRYSKSLAYVAKRDGFKIIRQLKKDELRKLPDNGWKPLRWEMN